MRQYLYTTIPKPLSPPQIINFKDSKRKRFFASDTGVKFHQEFMKTTEIPLVKFNQIEHAQIDDSVVMGIVQRARQQGFDAYLLPQSNSLPMANRREDILIIRP